MTSHGTWNSDCWGIARAFVALGLLLSTTFAWCADAPVHVVTLDQPIRSRGESVSISILNGPASGVDPRVRLSRNGVTEEFRGVYTPPSATGAAGVVTTRLAIQADRAGADKAQEPRQLALGKYIASVEFDSPKRSYPVGQWLEIVPPGAADPKLHEFVPASTDETADAFFDDSGRSAKGDAQATRVIDLTLRGSGFQAGTQQNDNVIFINGIHVPVQWGTCRTPDLGSANAPVPRVVVGEVLGPEELRLCRLPVPDNGEVLVQAGWGDRLSPAQKFRVFRYGRPSVTFLSAAVALALALIPLGLLGLASGGYRIFNREYRLRLLFLDPETDTYSLSKLQFYLWTVAALFSYTYLFISRVLVQHMAWPDVPGTLPGLIAVSAGTSIGSQLITGAKGSKGAGSTQPGIADFITSGGVVAPDRLQMFLWTLFGVGAFLVAVIEQYPGTISELPAIPERLLYLMGLSSAGYLGGKLARKAGPVINEISVSPTEPDDVIVRAMNAPHAETPDFSPALAVARSERATLPKTTNAPASEAVAALSAAISEATAAQTPGDVDKLVGRLAELRAQANEKAVQAAQAYANAPDDAARAAAVGDATAAQTAAAVLQDFSADITQAIAVSAVAPMQAMTVAPLIARTITLRGTNLSMDGLVEIDGAPLTFRMLLNDEGMHGPTVLARESDSPTFSRVLKFSIDPTRLEESDLTQFRKWFGAAGVHKFTLTNPDGQKAETVLSVPPSATQH